jgi:hypothetical protein
VQRRSDEPEIRKMTAAIKNGHKADSASDALARHFKALRASKLREQLKHPNTQIRINAIQELKALEQGA